MGRSSASPDRVSSGDEDDSAAAEDGGLGLRSIGDRFLFKRSSNFNPNPTNAANGGKDRGRAASSADRRRSHLHARSGARRLLLFPFRGRSWFYLFLFFAVFAFALASMVLQSSIASLLRPGSVRRKSVLDGLKFGSSLKFVPARAGEGIGLDRLRSQSRLGVRPPRLALVLGNMSKDPTSLMLFTVVKNLQELGYKFKIYAVEDGRAHSMWEKIGGPLTIPSPERYGHIDWLMFEGVIVDSLEGKDAISSLVQEPFCSVPLIWIIQEDALANRLPVYKEMGWENLLSHWKNTFSRADVTVFPDFSLPMLYSVLDTGNFFVIPGSPVDVWAAESYSNTHSKIQLRKDNGFDKDDMLVLIVGSSFFYNELSWDYALAMHDIEPLLVKYASRNDVGGAFKFLFLCGNSSVGYNGALQEIATHLGVHQDSLSHYGMDSDVNGLLLMADIVLYGSSQDVQSFPPLLTRAMSFGIPVIAPGCTVIKKYVVDGVNGMVYTKHKPDTLLRAFSLLISKGKLSKFAHAVGYSGRQLAKNMQASDCIAGYAKLLENVLTVPSDVLLPGQIQVKQDAWEWNLFREEMEERTHDVGILDQDSYMRKLSVVSVLEEELTNLFDLRNTSESESEMLVQDFPTDLDWGVLMEIEGLEEVEMLEEDAIEERMEKDVGEWDDIYRNARKSEKLKFEANERDEGELERTGQAMCIYEIYSGTGAWPFLHHGSLYRGLSLSRRARRLRSDDVDAVGRLPFLNDTYYQDILCEIGGMFAVAKNVDNIHKRPWIGFQSWRAAGRKVSLSSKAEKVLEEIIKTETKGDVIYYWASLGTDGGLLGTNDVLTFWSMCDILNGGNCRTVFEEAFRQMYALPSHVDALPPMPEDGGHWSSLHSWVMPTPSFQEFIMFSRMFADSLNALHTNSSKITTCLLGSSNLEKKHCYCRILEVLVNVWAYHSARKMVYLDPRSGSLQEQHPVEERKGFMWVKYFNSTLLKSMDEDLAEAADDGDHPSEAWLWPLTGEIYWRGVYEREREERYRLKMDKKRKTKEKLLDRMKHGYKQKSLGG
ncbi:uncharacterized protein LOC127797913 [Diospyros lotus]|uniref:uncharacterized protein LOC127797913 n=1 Tax=Diospyros lotus TaxID=55363 RepID=UPI0022525449|nr:uncharacterized protein LOC127797913 [Diospyros lotus]